MLIHSGPTLTGIGPRTYCFRCATSFSTAIAPRQLERYKGSILEIAFPNRKLHFCHIAWWWRSAAGHLVDLGEQCCSHLTAS
jgi:hypothetical protein